MTTCTNSYYTTGYKTTKWFSITEINNSLLWIWSFPWLRTYHGRNNHQSYQVEFLTIIHQVYYLDCHMLITNDHHSHLLYPLLWWHEEFIGKENEYLPHIGRTKINKTKSINYVIQMCHILVFQERIKTSYESGLKVLR